MNKRQCRPMESRLGTLRFAFAAFVKGGQTVTLARSYPLWNFSDVAFFHEHLDGIDDYSGP